MCVCVSFRLRGLAPQQVDPSRGKLGGCSTGGGQELRVRTYGGVMEVCVLSGYGSVQRVPGSGVGGKTVVSGKHTTRKELVSRHE